MNDSATRESGPPSPDEDRTALAGLVATLHRVGDSELASLCALAVAARELCDGRRCRVECPGEGAGEGDHERDRDPAADEDPGWYTVPVRGFAPQAGSDVRIAVELRGDERAPPGIGRLDSLVALAGLVLERHRFAAEARRARSEAEDVGAVLEHALRGHLHGALLRADNLLLDLREAPPPSLDDVREQLEVLKSTVEEMVEEIREVLDGRDPGRTAPPRPAAGPPEEVSVPELLREAADRAGGRAGDGLRVEVEGEVPSVPADPAGLGSALDELFELAVQSAGRPTLTVRPHGPSSGVRVDLSVDLPSLPRPDDGPADPGTEADPSSASRDPGGSAGDGTPGDRPSLRQAVSQTGGRLRVVAGEETRARIVVLIPGAPGSGRRPPSAS